MSNPLVSVLVPVYGVEKYIERSARSIFEQTYENLEIIFVNDCTPDSSIDILRHVLSEYPTRVSQTRIMTHDTNKGLAAARKTALLASSGYYIQNYDSDDYVDVDMIQQMVALAQDEDADIIVCDYKQVYESDGHYRYIKVSPSLDPETCLHQILSGKVHSSLCNKLIKKSLYIENDILPIEGLNMREDLSVMYKLMYYAYKIAYIPKAYYYYVQTGTGYTAQKMSLSHQKNAIQLTDEMEKFFYKHKASDIILEGFRYFKAGILCSIALYGDLGYYKHTITYFRDISLKDIQTQPTTSFILKTAGIFLHLKLMLLLKIMRSVVSAKKKMKMINQCYT